MAYRAALDAADAWPELHRLLDTLDKTDTEALSRAGARRRAGQFDGQGDHHTPPAYVEQVFRKYLEFGIFAHGFLLALLLMLGIASGLVVFFLAQTLPGTLGPLSR